MAQEMNLNCLSVLGLIEANPGLEGLRDKVSARVEEEVEGKLIFAAHQSLEEIKEGLKTMRLVQGVFRKNVRNYLEGFVKVNSEEGESILVRGVEDMNRAVDGDVVAVEVEGWDTPGKEDRREFTSTEDCALTEVGGEMRTGRVVAVIQRRVLSFCGFLQPGEDSENRLTHLVVPLNRRFPKIMIETRQYFRLSDKKVVVAIDFWARDSFYPRGHLVSVLGVSGTKETETEATLIGHDIPHDDFSRAVLSCLPPPLWSIPPEERRRRVDFTGLDVCSVDPPGCTDIDDALHCRRVEGGIEVGVHIADVTHFVLPDSPLDRCAQERGTTVYLVDKRVDMIPSLLSSNLCSLQADQDRLAFSVLLLLDEDANVLRRSFCKSVIRSKASLTYKAAQMMIDDVSKSDSISLSLRTLNRLAKILKRRRLESGSIALASVDCLIEMDSNDPVDVVAKQLLETNSMIEEFMLLANISVALRIVEHFPHSAVIRNHREPPASNFAPLKALAALQGLSIDASSGLSLSRSLDAAVVEDNPYFNTLLRLTTSRCFLQAQYCCAGCLPPQDYFHYGLAAPVYTHFTSPIRRYADIMVHRLLAVAIGVEQSFPQLLDRHLINETCKHLNYRTKMARDAGRASFNLFSVLSFKGKPRDVSAYIIGLRRNAIDVIVPQYKIETSILLDEAHKVHFDDQKLTMIIGTTRLGISSRVVVNLSVDESYLHRRKISVSLVEPSLNL